MAITKTQLERMARHFRRELTGARVATEEGLVSIDLPSGAHALVEVEGPASMAVMVYRNGAQRPVGEHLGQPANAAALTTILKQYA